MLVSINCIAYNHEKYIGQAIEGFLMQKTNFDFEIIIGEDCSTDRTRDIIHSHMERNPGRITLVTSETNVGASQNSMRVFAASSGKYIALCEGDDYWTDENKLQKQIDYLESHPSCSMCFHAANGINEKDNRIEKSIRPYFESRNSPIDDLIYEGGGFCHTGSIIFKRDLFEFIPSFLTQAHVGDYPLQMWCASQGEVYYMDEAMSVYRSGAKDSWTNKIFSRKESMITLVQNDISLLQNFNKETYAKYETIVQKTIRKKEFELLIIQNNFAEIRADKYRDILAELSWLERTKLYTRSVFPKFYLVLAQKKGELRRRKVLLLNRRGPKKWI